MDSAVAPPETTLDFGPAMSQFQSMFPGIIEGVLRKHNGDVSSTIDELLVMSSKHGSASSSRCAPSECGSSSSNCQAVSVPPMDTQQKQASNCADDEKIALLIQNREFLRYLQRDAQFMREINAEPHYHGRNSRRLHHYHHTYGDEYHHRSPRPLPPMLLSSSRPFSSPNNCRFQEVSYESSKNRHKNQRTPALPDGPVVDFSEGSIPNGPMIDCPKSSSGNWTQKIKSHLPLVKKPSHNLTTRQPTVGEMYVGEPEPVDYGNNEEEHLTNRLQNMSRNSKTLLLTLAKKFSLSKRDGHLRPTEYGEQSKDFSYQIHQN